MLYQSRSFRRSGLTLLELVVVLVILVALAGVVVPLISNTLSQTRYSTTGANLQEVATLVSSYQGKYGRYPDGWDTLTVSSGTGSGATSGLAAYLPGNAAITGGGTTLLSTYLTTITVAAGDNTSTPLFNAGMVNFYPFVAAPANPTFYPYGTAESSAGPTSGTTVYNVPTPTVISTAGGTLALLTPAGAQLLNLPVAGTTSLMVTTPNYVVLGLGSRNSMIPKTILDAPVAFSDNYASGPNFVYARFGVVFQVTDGTTNNNPLPAAVMVAVVAFTNEQGISTLGNQIEKYNNALQIGQ